MDKFATFSISIHTVEYNITLKNIILTSSCNVPGKVGQCVTLCSEKTSGGLFIHNGVALASISMRYAKTCQHVPPPQKNSIN